MRTLFFAFIFLSLSVFVQAADQCKKWGDSSSFEAIRQSMLTLNSTPGFFGTKGSCTPRAIRLAQFLIANHKIKAEEIELGLVIAKEDEGFAQLKLLNAGIDYINEYFYHHSFLIVKDRVLDFEYLQFSVDKLEDYLEKQFSPKSTKTPLQFRRYSMAYVLKSIDLGMEKNNEHLIDQWDYVTPQAKVQNLNF